MIRKIIKIDEDKCNGCGACATACHEGAIEMVNGKAKLTKEDYCDGLGDCLPVCPTDAITFIERESSENKPTTQSISQLANWPVQLKLVPVSAPYFNQVNLLIAADCTAYTYSNFHQEFIQNHITLIGCPKLDAIDYTEKLIQIIINNKIKSVTVTRMEVPCCRGIENAVLRALQASDKFIPWQIVTFSTDGKILEVQKEEHYHIAPITTPEDDFKKLLR